MNPIKYIFEKPYFSNKIAWWQIILAKYDIVYITRKSIKKSVIADHLEDNVVDDYESISFEFLDEDIMIVEEETNSIFPTTI